MERLTTNDQLRAAKRDWALAQCAKEKAAVADLIIAAVRSTKGRIDASFKAARIKHGGDFETLEGLSYDESSQLRGVRRLVASLGDALVTKDPGFDLPRFFSDCGYGS